VVLRRCNNVDRALVESKITEFAGRGYRALGLARAKGEGGELLPPADWQLYRDSASSCSARDIVSALA
jgi:hypothetical protein